MRSDLTFPRLSKKSLNIQGSPGTGKGGWVCTDSISSGHVLLAEPPGLNHVRDSFCYRGHSSWGLPLSVRKGQQNLLGVVLGSQEGRIERGTHVHSRD